MRAQRVASKHAAYSKKGGKESKKKEKANVHKKPIIVLKSAFYVNDTKKTMGKRGCAHGQCKLQRKVRRQKTIFETKKWVENDEGENVETKKMRKNEDERMRKMQFDTIQVPKHDKTNNRGRQRQKKRRKEKRRKRKRRENGWTVGEDETRNQLQTRGEKNKSKVNY